MRNFSIHLESEDFFSFNQLHNRLIETGEINLQSVFKRRLGVNIWKLKKVPKISGSKKSPKSLLMHQIDAISFGGIYSRYRSMQLHACNFFSKPNWLFWLIINQIGQSSHKLVFSQLNQYSSFECWLWCVYNNSKDLNNFVTRANSKGLTRSSRIFRASLDFLAASLFRFRRSKYFSSFCSSGMGRFSPRCRRFSMHWNWSMDGRLPVDIGLQLAFDVLDGMPFGAIAKLSFE